MKMAVKEVIGSGIQRGSFFPDLDLENREIVFHAWGRAVEAIYQAFETV